MKWAYGVTTVPARKDALLPQTLDSLRNGGFDTPHLFVDGAKGGYEEFGLPLTYRFPAVRTAANWCLSLGELYARNPLASRYALFQDDLVCYRNLRQYLTELPYTPQTYWNLYTFPHNQKLAPESVGFFTSNQRGFGAVALVFDREAVIKLFTTNLLWKRIQCPNRGWRSIDGAIITALKPLGYKEVCHNPTLVQHVGKKSTTSNKFHPVAVSFRGRNFDAMELLRK